MKQASVAVLLVVYAAVVVAGAPTFCSVCTEVTTALQNKLKNHEVTRQALEEACNSIGETSAKEICTYMVNEHGDRLLQLVQELKESEPAEVCSQIKEGVTCTDTTTCEGMINCVEGCGSDVLAVPVCVDGSWQCPAGFVSLDTCPQGTCWGVPPPNTVCEDGEWVPAARYHKVPLAAILISLASTITGFFLFVNLCMCMCRRRCRGNTSCCKYDTLVDLEQPKEDATTQVEPSAPLQPVQVMSEMWEPQLTQAPANQFPMMYYMMPYPHGYTMVPQDPTPEGK
jgi:hypothetical protein